MKKNNSPRMKPCLGTGLIILFIVILFLNEGFSFMKTKLNKNQEELLQNIEEFNKTTKDKGWNLANKIIESKDLSGIRLINSIWRDVDVKGSQFVSASFEGCVFSDISFIEVDFSKTSITNCKFESCKFMDTNFNQTKLSKSRFADCRMEKINLNESQCEDIAWDDNQSKNIDWKYAKIKNLKIHGGTYEYLSFADSKISNSEILKSVFKKCGFSGSTLEYCQFKINGDVVNFVDSTCTHLKISGDPDINDLKLAGLKGSDIQVENLKNSELFVMSFAKVDKFSLENVKLMYTSSVSASYSNSTFRNVRFDFAQFNDSKYKNVTFDNVMFGGEIIFDGSSLDEVEFKNISKADDYKGSFKNTTFSKTDPY